MTRMEIKAAQMNLLIAKNALLPNLRFTSQYGINGFGTRLDGNTVAGINPATGLTNPNNGNALRSLSDGNFNNWSIGLVGSIPIGYRLAHTEVRQAQLSLARTMETLRDQELKAQSFLYEYYRRLSTNYEQIRANRAQREAFAEQLKARQQAFQAGRDTLDTLLEAQRFWAQALAAEYQQVVAYNNALAGFEYAKGTIMQHNNIHIAEGMLPNCAAVRAVEHERERTAACVVRERATPVPVTPTCCAPTNPNGKAPTLPAVMAATPPLKDAPPLPAVLPNNSGTPIPGPVESKTEELFTPPSRLPSSSGGSNGGAASSTNNGKPGNPMNNSPAAGWNKLPAATLPTASGSRSDFGTERGYD
jgi:hypothetical protein